MSLDLDRYLVISSDGHAGLPMEDHRKYVDPEFRAPRESSSGLVATHTIAGFQNS